MNPFLFDKEKYLHIMATKTPQDALTELHHDMEHWEYAAFEGEKGYQPELLRSLETVRAFSRELWNTANERKP